MPDGQQMTRFLSVLGGCGNWYSGCVVKALGGVVKGLLKDAVRVSVKRCGNDCFVPNEAKKRDKKKRERG
jgi:hypothetical protein